MNKHTSSVRYTVRRVYAILTCLNRQDELSRLAQWAEKKRFSKPLRLYRFRLDEEERRIFRYRQSSPELMPYARVLHGLSKLLNSKPRYYYKESARAYRRQA